MTRLVSRLGLATMLSLPLVAVGLAGPAGAAPICTPSPSGTTCVDPTGTCLVAYYPHNSSQAICLKNPFGDVIVP